MKTTILTGVATLVSATALGLGAAQAATIDLSPVISEAINAVLVPVALAIVPTIGAVLTLPIKRFLDEKSGSDLALRVNDLLDKAIAYGAREAQSFVGDHDFHVTADSMVANLAATYALGHAPALLKKVGAAAAAKASDAAKAAAGELLQQKIIARLAGNPDVAALKAAAPAPAAAAA